MSSEFVWRFVMIAAAIGVVWLVVRPKYSIRIVVDGGRVTGHHGVAHAKLARVVEFLERDVGLDKKTTILGYRNHSGVLRFSFRGDLDWGTRQQIRNYLKMVL